MTGLTASHWARSWFGLALVALVIARLLAAIWAAVWNIRGDYYASMPGAYVRMLNPTLWNSQDMQGTWGYHRETYFHGPVQYLTLYPLALLDSYQQIAWLLMPLYALALSGAFWCLRRALVALAPDQPLTVPLVASTFLFFPLLQAYIQREFEVVVLLGLAAALWLLLQDRRNAAAAILAYVAWFKYAPLLFVGYLGLRRWFKAAAVFLVTSLLILGAAHLVFGLTLFVNNNVPAHAAQVLYVWDFEFRRGPEGYLYGLGFCQGWFETETTLANVRHGLCSLSARSASWLPPNMTYLLLCAAIAVVYVHAHNRLQRVVGLDSEREAWRRALEFSIVTTVYVCFLFNHYYYLIVLIVPLNVLLIRYLSGRHPLRLCAWVAAYFLISAFVVPISVLTRVFGVDVWALYIKGAWFMYGELVLMALLLREYWEVSVGRPAQPIGAERLQNSMA